MANLRLCSIPGCGKPHQARGWCKMHQTRWLRRGSLERKGRRTGICAVEGCDSPIRNRGWCLSHYERWRRHGNPESGRIASGEARRFLAEDVLPYHRDECLIWPYTRDWGGYAKIGKNSVHRVVCSEVNGPPPTAIHQATHSCGNGHLGCVNPRHLRWKTAAGNSADMVAHGRSQRGTKHPQSILDEEKVRTILALKGTATQRELGERFGVSQGTIWRIHQRKIWAWLE